MTAPEVLARAAGIVRERGHWKKNDPRSGYGYCALTAISSATGMDPEWANILEPCRALAAYLGHDDIDTDAEFIIAWNDAPERTAEEVATALDVAGLIAGAQAQPVRTLVAPRSVKLGSAGGVSRG